MSNNEKTVWVHVEGYGEVQFNIEMGTEGEHLLVPSERLARLEETATHRQMLKDAQDEARSLYDSLLKKQMSGSTLETEEKKQLLIAERFLQVPMTLSSKKDKKTKMQTMDSEETDTVCVADENDLSPNVPQLHSKDKQLSKDREGSTGVHFPMLDSKIYNGGPVESIGVLHNIPILPGIVAKPSIIYSEGQYFHVWRDQIHRMLSDKDILRFFLGECTWSSGQLVDELKHGCWIMCEPTAEQLGLRGGMTIFIAKCNR